MRKRSGVLRLKELGDLIRGCIFVRYVSGVYTWSNLEFLKVNFIYELPANSYLKKCLTYILDIDILQKPKQN